MPYIPIAIEAIWNLPLCKNNVSEGLGKLDRLAGKGLVTQRLELSP